MLPTSKTSSLSNQERILSSAEDIRRHFQSVDFEAATNFSIDGYSIGAEAGVALQDMLASMKALKSANFLNIFSGRQKEETPRTLAAICEGLKNKDTLVELDLSDNAVGIIAVGSLVPFLVENHSLRVLKLNNVGFGPEAGTIVARALLQSIHNQPSNLRAIICGRSRLEDGSAAAWSDVFAGHPNLVAVHIPQNGFRKAGLTTLAHGLQSCRALRYLDISDNVARQVDATRKDPDVDAATSFANALSSWKNLEYLALSDCCLEASSTRAIIDALSKGNNTNLKALLLENAMFDASFGPKLLTTLDESLPNLVTLNLAESEGLGDTDAGAWPEIIRIITGRAGGVVVFERNIEDDEDTAFLDNLLADLVALPESDSLVEAMAGMSVSRI
ncbi:hypothetical protein FB451DRAFT_1024384 [Mycena latifolia]|nr:hypothetical protein FB451DRAFT_1024384 [Mycena latifolia]